MSDRSLLPFLPLLVPIAARWVAAQEALILAAGETLVPAQLLDARDAGVQCPEMISVLYVEAIPMTGHRVLVALGRWTGLVSPQTSGITLNYGIYIRRPYRNNRSCSFMNAFMLASMSDSVPSPPSFALT